MVWCGGGGGVSGGGGGGGGGVGVSIWVEQRDRGGKS